MPVGFEAIVTNESWIEGQDSNQTEYREGVGGEIPRSGECQEGGSCF